MSDEKPINKDDPLVTVRHMREARFCARGGRVVAARYNLDFLHFVTHGYSASVLEATGDAMLIKLATMAREEAEDEA